MLDEYKKKRDFSKTPEPKDKSKEEKNIFVIQKHDASHLHYDFRLEVNGVLKSWAIPKGISLNPSDKRLGVMTEDHPLDYKDFEGVIPEGYGEGTVMVWDYGEYENIGDKSMEKSLEEGHANIKLNGKKVKGKFSLVNFKGKNWLIIKKKEDNPPKTNIHDKSVLSGKTMDEIREG